MQGRSDHAQVGGGHPQNLAATHVKDSAAVEGGEFTHSAVPESATTPAYKIGVILLAGNITLPALVMGGELGIGLGFKGVVMACLWGGLILAFLAGACAYAGARSRLTTYVLIAEAFGRRGGEFINTLLSLSAIGWFGVVVMLFSSTIVNMIHNAFGGLPLWGIAGTFLMVVTTIFGFKALNLLSNVMLPLKLALLAWAVMAAIQKYGVMLSAPPSGVSALDPKTAVSYVVGGWVVGAIAAPDFARFARQPLGGAWACAFALGVGYPLVLVASSIPAISTGQKDLIATMVTLNMGLAALSIVLLASWSNGASNLYSGSLMLAAVFRRSHRLVLVIAAGVVGMVLGLLGIADRLVPYLLVLSIIVPPIAGVYLPRFFINQAKTAKPSPPRDWEPAALMAWVLGVAVAGISDRTGYALTGIAAIDSLLVSAIAYLVFEFVRRRREREPAVT